jgi:hypothetical protein
MTAFTVFVFLAIGCSYHLLSFPTAPERIGRPETHKMSCLITPTKSEECYVEITLKGSEVMYCTFPYRCPNVLPVGDPFSCHTSETLVACDHLILPGAEPTTLGKVGK